MNQDRNDHKWGFSDTKFEVNPDRSVRFTGDRYDLCGYDIPGLIPFVEEVFDIKLDLSEAKQQAEPPALPVSKVSEPQLRELRKFLSEDQVSDLDRDRLVHSHGQTTADEVYQVLYNSLEKVCDLVVYPETSEQVAALIKTAKDQQLCLVPYGGGTSVSCALKLPLNESRPIVVANTLRMNQVLSIDEENLTAHVQAGITGAELERQLETYGLTCGHEPDSMEFSTLGGWIATNASGMKKNRYGNIEDVVLSVEMITPNGEISQLSLIHI